MIYVCTSSDMHPYECGGDCIHCRAEKTEHACSHVSIDSDGPLCNPCSDLHTRALERMEDGDAVASFSEVCSVAAHGWPIEREAVWRVG